VALTPKQEGFCLSYRETGNASEAYRRNYSTENQKPETINRNAKTLLDNSKILARLSELGAVTAKRHAVTVDSLIAELEEARQAALSAESPQSAAAVGATMGKAKLMGMDKQVIDHQSSDGSMRPPAPVYKIVRE
jgi:phage terminase small subunit